MKATHRTGHVITLDNSITSVLLASRYTPLERSRCDWLAIATALVASAAAWAVAPETGQPALRVLLVLLAMAAVVDLRTMRIPNQLSMAAAIAAVAAWTSEGGHLAPLLIAAAVGAFMAAGFLTNGVGAGDVKMMPSLALAALARQSDLGVTVIYACALLTSVFTLAIVFHAVSGAGRREHSPLAPSMLLAGFGALIVTGASPL